MTLQISCEALELCHYFHVLVCLSMQGHRVTLQEGVCVSASKCVFLYVRTCVHQGMGPILSLCMSLCRFNPLYQGHRKDNEGEILMLTS